jgi:hypothetical protein
MPLNDAAFSAALDRICEIRDDKTHQEFKEGLMAAIKAYIMSGDVVIPAGTIITVGNQNTQTQSNDVKVKMV